MVMACIDSGHKTMENIRKTGAFGLNIPTVRELDLVRYCGSVSGHEGDKLGPRGIRTFQGTAIAELPLLDACAGWLECRPVEVAGASTHDIVVARVLGASARTGALRGDWSWNAQQFPVVHHLGGKRFIVSQEQA
jgi:flavin reductase (DIM6/NTAB) family NADH-FMN oxidoreductase RutF